MEISEKMESVIKKKLASCEKMYGVKVLFWSFRGSLNIGISRKNSDLDLIFVFINLTEKRVAAIHDIIGYGFDFWGWDIEDAIRTIEMNNAAFYKDHIGYKMVSLSGEHARGGLTYYSGIYCYIGNTRCGSDFFDINELSRRLVGVMEKSVLINHILMGTELEMSSGMSACDYLYMIWRVLLAEHVYKDGLPGEGELDSLMMLYMDQGTMDIVNKLRGIYHNSLSKHSQFFKIEELNTFIRDGYFFLKKRCEELPAQHEATAQSQIDDLKFYIKQLEV